MTNRGISAKSDLGPTSLLAASCVMLLAFVSHSNPSKAAAPGLVPIGTFNEHFEENVLVSGTTLVGLRRGSAAGPLSIDDLAVDLPAGAKGMLCLDLSTRDGRYTAAQDFKLDGPHPGPAPLGLRSATPEHLRTYSHEDLAVRAQMRGDCGEGPPGAYLAARWSNGAPGDDILVAYVNVKLSRASIHLLDVSGAEITGHSIGCEPITAGARTAFDHECRLALQPGAAQKAAGLRLDIVGASGSRRTETYKIALAP